MNRHIADAKKTEISLSPLEKQRGEPGKTKEAAGRIAQLSGADLAEIKTHKSYRMSYRKTVFTALKEILLNERPELDMEIPDISAIV